MLATGGGCAVSEATAVCTSVESDGGVGWQGLGADKMPSR